MFGNLILHIPPEVNFSLRSQMIITVLGMTQALNNTQGNSIVQVISNHLKIILFCLPIIYNLEAWLRHGKCHGLFSPRQSIWAYTAHSMTSLNFCPLGHQPRAHNVGLRKTHHDHSHSCHELRLLGDCPVYLLMSNKTTTFLRLWTSDGGSLSGTKLTKSPEFLVSLFLSELGRSILQ